METEIKKFPILYSKATTGKIIQWSMEVKGASYRTLNGYIDGKLNVSKWRACTGKNIGRSNETTPEQQAIIEVESEYTYKERTGYSSDINKAGAQSYIEVMTAKNVNDIKGVDPLSDEELKHIIVQEKKNGVRSYHTIEHSKSREGMEFKQIPHIREELSRLFETVAGAVVDGECNNEAYRERLNEIMKIMGPNVTITDDVLKRSKEIIQLHIYDFYCDEMPEDVPYIKRMAFLKEKLITLGISTEESLSNPNSAIQFLKNYRFETRAEVEAKFGEYVENGGEGLILRYENMPYEHKRSKYLLKFKPEMDDECEILAIFEGEGNWSGAAKRATIKWQGKVFDASFKNKFEHCAKVLENKEKWIGLIVTFHYTGLTGKGTPNFARIDPLNCFNDKSSKGVIYE